ncbi:MFS transporter [Streptomyces collinus]|uniref:MFS transporter n=1 Tax=Streptomyces collinus TaxID=42684 RepID=UPI0037D0FE06
MSATLAPLRHRPFRHLFIGTTANLLGSGVAPIALAFAVLDATGSVGSLGSVVGAHSLTSILFLLYGGVLADRLPRGPLLVGSSVVSAASQAVIAALVLTHSAAIPLLMVLGSFLALPLAQFAAGPAVLLLGLQATLYAAAALILLATLTMVATPSVRALIPKAAEPLPASEDPVPG